MSRAARLSSVGSQADVERDQRTDVALDAGSELETLIAIIEREKNTENFDVALRGILKRMRELVGVVLSVAGGDNDRELEEMRAAVGCGAPGAFK